MAQNREYAYFLKGNKIAISEKDWRFGGGQTTDVPGLNDVGQTGSTYWKSPSDDSSLGLEIEYAYNPYYTIPTQHAINQNKFYVNGWTVVDGYVAFARGASNSNATDWTAAPFSTVTSGSRGDTADKTRDYILVRNSSKWNGLHRIQNATTYGLLVTHTKTSDRVFGAGTTDFDFAATGDYIYNGDGNQPAIGFGDQFDAGDYILIGGADASAGKNNGIFRISKSNKNTSIASNNIQVDARVYHPNLGSDSVPIGTEGVQTTNLLVDETDQTDIRAYKIIHEPNTYLLTDIDPLSNEDDVIEINTYLSKALVCYVKARMAEDQMNIEAKEYYMRMFREKLEKHDTSRIWGKKATMPSRSAIR
tara:strand:+ start:401 stop:1486 length:1086 start_codon:yes stop_codon:yes gene_type:complete